MTEEKLIISGQICPYCKAAPDLVDSAEVYGQSYAGRFWMYLCRKCKAYVGTHSNTQRPLGRLANAELREWKKKAHYYFDILWHRKIKQGFTQSKARGLAYKWLAKQMGILPEQAHIGMFDVEQCKQVVGICKPHVVGENKCVTKTSSTQ